MPDYNHTPVMPRVGLQADLAAAVAMANELLWTTDGFRLYVEQGGAKKLVGEADFLKLVGGTLSGTLTIIQPTLGNEVLRLESVTATDDPNYIVTHARVATTNATATELAVIPIADGIVMLLEVRIIARQVSSQGAGTVGQGAAYIRQATFRRIGDTVAQIGSTVSVLTTENEAGWDVAVPSAVSTDSIQLKVTGAANETIIWHATIIKQTVGT